MGKVENNVIGKKFGRLTIISTYIGKNEKTYTNCICDCGKTKDILLKSVVNGSTKSCGCLRKINHKSKVIHGYTNTAIYRCWNSMLSRCNNKNNANYNNYGGRGIIVCERWHKFENFLEDMGEKPNAGLSLDRIDNNGNYCLENCRWATNKEQMRNRRNTKNINLYGKDTPLTELAEKKGLNPQTVRKRLDRGWNNEEAIENPRREYELIKKTRNKQIAQERKNIIEALSKTCDIPKNILYRRIFYFGFSIEKATTLPVDKQILLEYHGKTITLSELVKITGLAKSSLWCRIFKKNMSVDEAIKDAYNNKFKKKNQTTLD